MFVPGLVCLIILKVDFQGLVKFPFKCLRTFYFSSKGGGKHHQELFDKSIGSFRSDWEKIPRKKSLGKIVQHAYKTVD